MCAAMPRVRKNKRLMALPLFVAFALGCSPKVESSAQVHVATAPSNTANAVGAIRTPPSLEVAVSYACAEKYATDSCMPGSKEYTQWIATAEIKPSTERILSIQAGGPLGAEWNPSNDLVVFAPKMQEPRALRVGTITISPSDVMASGWVVFHVPLRDWRQAERPARQDDGFEKDTDTSMIRVVEMELTLGQDPQSRRVLITTAYGE